MDNDLYTYTVDGRKVQQLLRFAVHVPEAARTSPEFIDIISGRQMPDKFARLNLLQVAVVMAEEKDYVVPDAAAGVRLDTQSGSTTAADGVVVVKSDTLIELIALSGDVMRLVKIAHKHFTRHVRLDVK